MLFIKSLSNNVALVKDARDREFVVIGRGVGFGKKRGDDIPPDTVQRRFISDAQNNAEWHELQHFDPRAVTLTEMIVRAAERELTVQFSRHQYLALADHLDLVLKRMQQCLVLTGNAMSWQVRRLYPREYALAKRLVRHITSLEKYGSFTIAEVPALVLHLVNAANKQEQVQDTMAMTRLIGAVIQIVERDQGMTLDTESFSYSRFLVHLEAFFRHAANPAAGEEGEPVRLDDDLLQLLQEKYPRAYQTVGRIKQFLYQQHHWVLSENEQAYLTIHIWRVTHVRQA